MSDTQTPAAPAAPAANPNPTPAAPAAAAPAPASDWTTGFNDDLKGYVQNKQFKDPASAIESYRNLEKLMGAPKDKLLKLPDNMDDATAMGEIYSKLGKPPTPAEYGLSKAKDADPEFSKFMEDTFHGANLNKKQAEFIAAKYGELMANKQTQSAEKYEAKQKAEEAALKKDWGMAHDQNLALAKNAAREFKVDAAVIEAMESAVGYDKTMKFFADIGSKIGEPSFHSNNSGNTLNMTPEAARNKIANLKQDTEFYKRLSSGDASAKAEWDRAHKMAYPET